MARYFVGDIQGCFDELKALLIKVDFSKQNDELWLAGDLVARGPKSLETLRFVKSLGNSAKVVLGNHDLHLLAIHAGIKKAKPSDLLDELLLADDINELMDWLIQQPLIQKVPNEATYMSHAGIPPQWSIEQAMVQAKHAQKLLTSKEKIQWLQGMYGEKPSSWEQVETEQDKFRFTINALTRMRYCLNDKSLEFSCKLSPNQADNSIKPWFELSKTLNNCSWIFGHWASLMGNCSHPNAYALDTGCVWGNHLTLLRWHDKKYFYMQSYKSNEKL